MIAARALAPDTLEARRQRARQLIAWAGDHLELTGQVAEYLARRERATLEELQQRFPIAHPPRRNAWPCPCVSSGGAPSRAGPTRAAQGVTGYRPSARSRRCVLCGSGSAPWRQVACGAVAARVCRWTCPTWGPSCRQLEG
jgi:hypothetical protein